MSDDTATSGTEHIEVGLPSIDGYDVTVSVPVGIIAREIERQEQGDYEAINLYGPAAFNCSRFVTVRVEPTTEKWEELADRSLDTDNERGGGDADV